MFFSLLIGLFVGGVGARLGGVPKGNLKAPSGERILERLARVSREALPEAPLVLVGGAGPYVDLGFLPLLDSPAGIGPLGGLRALLLHARDAGHRGAVTLACDLPYLGSALVGRLANEAPEADFLAPRAGGLWHTLTARYSVAALSAVDATIAEEERALQNVVSRLGERAVELVVDAHELAQLRDWDRPEDIE